jgi:hypothetical protein
VAENGFENWDTPRFGDAAAHDFMGLHRAGF